MGLNCRPGDLAVVIKSATGASIGRIVTCVRQDVGIGLSGMYDGWITEPELTPYNASRCVVPDAWLRPIRDTDGEDETLTWCPRKLGVNHE